VHFGIEMNASVLGVKVPGCGRIKCGGDKQHFDGGAYSTQRLAYELSISGLFNILFCFANCCVKASVMLFIFAVV